MRDDALRAEARLYGSFVREDSRFPHPDGDEAELVLVRWMRVQRRAFRLGLLTADQTRILDRHCWSWRADMDSRRSTWDKGTTNRDLLAEPPGSLAPLGRVRDENRRLAQAAAQHELERASSYLRTIRDGGGNPADWAN
jgi:hypothetical protein